MADFRQTKSFEKALIKACPNYDETKVFVIPYSKPSLNGVCVNLVAEGKVLKIDMYMSQYEIDEWAGHIDAACVSGEFDWKIYFLPYPEENIDDFGKENGYSLTVDLEFNKRNGRVSMSSSDQHEKLTEYRKTYPDSGFKKVRKPLKRN